LNEMIAPGLLVKFILFRWQWLPLSWDTSLALKLY
jgi:hypothetical protein